MRAPKVTFLLTAHEQQEFAAAAARSVLAQDASPLEIILSDDGSRDDTFAVIEREASGYRGPHRVVLNRNDGNLGSVEHLNKLMTMARGEFIVLGHGDDVAHPNRARLLAEAWTSSGRSLVTSNAIVTDAALRPRGRLTPLSESGGIPLDTLIANSSRPTLVGATMAWERAVFERFGPISVSLLPRGPGDQLLPLRAGLLKGVWFIAEPLLQYRQHERNMNHRHTRLLTKQTGSEYTAAIQLAVLSCMLEELVNARNRGDDSAGFRDAQRKLQRAVALAAHAWTLRRARLIAAGMHPTWISAAEFDARPQNPELHFSPGSDAEQSKADPS